jgi:alkylation response protein AidB-like acyl-CoA dehydrogenase
LLERAREGSTVEWNLSPEQDAYQEAFRDWLSDVAAPDVVRRWLDAGDAAAFEKLFADGGWGGVGLPEELGGQGGGLVELALTAEELARAAAPSAGWLATVLAVPALALAGHRDIAELALAGQTAAYLMPAECVPDEAPSLAVDAAGAVIGSVPRVLAGDTAAMFVVPAIPPGAADVRLDRAPSRRLELADPAEVLRQASARAAVLVAARSAVYFAAASVDAGGGESFLHAAAVKAQVTAEGSRAADSALTLHGAIGYTWEYDLQLFYKRARLDEKLLGTPAQWNERIASGLALV